MSKHKKGENASSGIFQMSLSHLSWLASGYENLDDKNINSDIHYKNMATSAPSQWYIDWKKCSVLFACHLQLN